MPNFIYTTTAVNAQTIGATEPYNSTAVDLFKLPIDNNGPPIGSASVQIVGFTGNGPVKVQVQGSLTSTAWATVENSTDVVAAATGTMLLKVILPFAQYVRYALTTTSTADTTVTMIASYK